MPSRQAISKGNTGLPATAAHQCDAEGCSADTFDVESSQEPAGLSDTSMGGGTKQQLQIFCPSLTEMG